MLPLVGSTSVVLPGLMAPRASASSIMLRPMRSFTLQQGCMISSLAATRPPPGATTRLRNTIGVLPTRSVMPAATPWGWPEGGGRGRSSCRCCSNAPAAGGPATVAAVPTSLAAATCPLQLATRTHRDLGRRDDVSKRLGGGARQEGGVRRGGSEGGRAQTTQLQVVVERVGAAARCTPALHAQQRATHNIPHRIQQHCAGNLSLGAASQRHARRRPRVGAADGGCGDFRRVGARCAKRRHARTPPRPRPGLRRSLPPMAHAQCT